MRPLRLEPTLLLGIDQVDQQHQALVDLINETQDILDQDGDRAHLVQILNRLSDHCVQHFTTEEALMLQAGYPDLQQHKKLHDVSLQQAFEFDPSRLSRDPDAGPALLEVLRDWLLAHIHADREMALFLKEKGVG